MLSSLRTKAAFMIPMLASALAFGLVATAPAEIPAGKFQTWASHKKAPLDFISDGVTVHVEGLPCPAQPVGDSTCRWEGYNNQGVVTVHAPGIAPLEVITDSQSEYARIAIVRFDARDARPGVIVESQYGGSGGILTAQLLIPQGNGYRAIPLARPDKSYLEGQIADMPRDISGDGIIDLRLADGDFDSAFGCNACTPRPPMFFAIKNGALVDESADPGLRKAFAAEMDRLAPRCFSSERYRNGACAAYVASAARAGRFKVAWKAMLKHYEREDTMSVLQQCTVPVSEWIEHRCPPQHHTHFADFPESLRAFLIRAGYLPA